MPYKLLWVEVGIVMISLEFWVFEKRDKVVGAAIFPGTILAISENSCLTRSMIDLIFSWIRSLKTMVPGFPHCSNSISLGCRVSTS